MEAQIKIATEKKLIGKRINMSFIENRTFQLWSSFMPKRREIKNSIDSNLYSLEVFYQTILTILIPIRVFKNGQQWPLLILM